MHTPSWTRRVVATAATTALVAGTVGLAAATSAGAATPTALTSTDTTYLSDTLGLPAQTVVETVTYDRFQWLLQQPGQYAFVIGSAYTPGFAEKVVKADLAAKAAGASHLYWFDPNLTGVEGVRNLDTRNPSGINLNASSQAIFGKVWTNVLGQYLGNGYQATPSSNRTTVTVAADDSVVNDTVDPVWDYRSTETPAVTSTDAILFVYDKDHTSGGAADKVVDWVNLSTTDTASVQAAVGDVLASVGGSALDGRSQFDWWKSAANFKHNLSYADDARYGGDILEDADNAAGWRVQQVTYPELVHLLNKNGANDNFVLLFGGTWCHNTRAVLKQVNKEAQDHGVNVVYNFDLVLDGGTVNGSNGGSNPIHVRDNAGANVRPSYVYGDIVSTYFPNVVTQYNPATSGVTYYPGGDLNAATQTVRKGQVPFLLHYQRGTGATPSASAVQRQWIQDQGAGTYREYMSEWWFTHPSAQLGLNFDISDESALTSQQQSQLANARANADFGAEAVAQLTAFFGALPGATPVAPAAATVVGSLTQAPTTSATGSYSVVAVGATGLSTPTGDVTVTFTLGSASYALAGTLSAGVAQVTVPALSAGTWNIAVSYAGDPVYGPASTTSTLTVTAPPSNTGGNTGGTSGSGNGGSGGTTTPTPTGGATPATNGGTAGGTAADAGSAPADGTGQDATAENGTLENGAIDDDAAPDDAVQVTATEDGGEGGYGTGAEQTAAGANPEVEGISTSILVLAGLVGLSLIAYVTTQLITKGRRTA